MMRPTSVRNRGFSMSDVVGNEDFFALLKHLIDKWCDRRALEPHRACTLFKALRISPQPSVRPSNGRPV
jgi:hypothetical protein